MKKSVIFCFLTAIIAIAMISCGDDEKAINVGSITITLNPAKTTLVTGEAIDVTVSVSPSNATMPTVTLASDNTAALSVTPKTGGWTLKAEGAGSAKITATATDGGGASAFVNITVMQPATLVSIAVTKQPDKLVYTVGDTFDPAGMEVEATYSDQSKEKVNNADLTFDYNFGTAGVNKTVIVKYQGKEDMNSVKVTVDPDITLTITGTYTYKGVPIVPEVTIKFGDATLSADTDYDLTYGETGNTNAGEVAVTATGKGTYAGKSVTGSFIIEKCPITVTADDIVERNFWDDTELTFTVNPPLFNGDEFTGKLTYISSELNEAGTFIMMQGDLSAGDNYEITFVEGVCEIYYFKGEGTEAKPYEIETAKQLAGLAGLVNSAATNIIWCEKYYRLTENIVLDAYQTGKGWVPIGSGSYPFKGNFDGNGKIVSGMKIDTFESWIGLFGRISSGTVKNLGVEGSINRSSLCGGVAGVIDYSSIITNCYTAVAIISNISDGSQCIGGIAGHVTLDSNVTNCYSTGAITTNGFYVGGVVGLLVGGSISNCYALGAINSRYDFGGLAGLSSMSFVENCAALNPSVTRSTGSLRSFGRVIGTNNFWDTNCVAWNEMEITAGATGRNGADITTAQIKADGTLGDRFTTANGWTIENGKLPGLFGKAVELPEHLKN